MEEEEDQIETRLPYIGKMCSSKFLLPSHSLPLSLIQRLGRNTFVSNTSQALLHITVMWTLYREIGLPSVKIVDCTREPGKCAAPANKPSNKSCCWRMGQGFPPPLFFTSLLHILSISPQRRCASNSGGTCALCKLHSKVDCTMYRAQHQLCSL